MVSLLCVVWPGGLVGVILQSCPAEMHIRGREVCDAGEFIPGPQQY